MHLVVAKVAQQVIDALQGERVVGTIAEIGDIEAFARVGVEEGKRSTFSRARHGGQRHQAHYSSSGRAQEPAAARLDTQGTNSALLHMCSRNTMKDRVREAWRTRDAEWVTAGIWQWLLDRLGEALLDYVRPMQMAVEAHRNVTEQKAPGWCGANALFLHCQEAVRDQRLRPMQRIGEISNEGNVVSFLGGADLDLTFAHQLLDDIGTQQIVDVELDATRHGQLVVIEGSAPIAHLPVVLTEAVADVTDPARPEADKIAAGMGSVPHEVAVESSQLLSPREVIIGQREVIHADVAISRRTETLHGQLQQRDTRRRCRKIGGRNVALRLEELGQVGVPINCHALRMCRDHAVQGAAKAVRSLQRQSIDQIDVDRAQPAQPTSLDHAQRLIHRLDAVDRLLHAWIQILDAEAHTVEAQLCERLDIAVMDHARVELNREIPVGAA